VVFLNPISKMASVEEKKSDGTFKDKLDKESLAYFNEVSNRPFSEQCVFFLNAFWDEVGSQAEYIYQVSWEIMKTVDMRNRNIHYIHLYKEGIDLDFDMALYFFESLVKFHQDSKNDKPWNESNYGPSKPKDMTAIVRKKEIREKVDVNFNGRVSFIEYLLYQYEVSPKSLMERSSRKGETNEALEKARKALDDVNKKIAEYEAEKFRLTTESEGTGVKALKAKNELAQLLSGPLAAELRKLLITAEAAVRMASKGLKTSSGDSGQESSRTSGAIWWLNRDLDAKKAKYGDAKKA